MKEIIIQLIVEDIKHNQLLNGLYAIGLSDNERYTSNIPLVVAQLMQKQPKDYWLDTYHQTMLNIPHEMTAKEALSAAQTLFEDLSITE